MYVNDLSINALKTQSLSLCDDRNKLIIIINKYLNNIILLSIIILMIVQKEQAAEWLPFVRLPLVQAPGAALIVHVHLQ